MSEQIEAGAPSRAPQQLRSKASFERMLAAAEKLLIKKGSDDFTLTEVSKAGKVSIGSIYCRFDSKDDLIQAVQARVIARIDADNNAILPMVRAKARSLEDFMSMFIDLYAESLQRHAQILRPIMLRATQDPVVSAAGKAAYERFAADAKAAMREYQNEFGSADHRRVVDTAYRVIYATIARYLGLGSFSEMAGEGNWTEMKEDLAIMCAAFLKSPAKRNRAKRAA